MEETQILDKQSDLTKAARQKLIEEGWSFHNWAGTDDDTPIMKKGALLKIIMRDGEVYDL